MFSSSRLRAALPCATLSLGLALMTAGCSGDASTSTTSTATTTASASAAGAATTDAGATSTATGPLTVDQPWVKAVKGGMTGVFATLRNDSDKPVHVTGATTPVADMVQLHVTEKDASGAMVMRETKDGFVVPAHGTFELRPGGNHIMLMGLKGAVLSGNDVAVTLRTEDGKEVTFQAPAREFNGAKETYGGMQMTPNATHSAVPSGAATSSHGGH